MDIDTKRHKAIVREETARRVKAYAERLRPGESVSPMIDLAMPKRTDRVLDVACGAGRVAIAFAPLVNSVVGIDLTQEMVDLAYHRAREQGITNAAFILGDAERLKFAPRLFDLVTCRSTFHLLVRPEKALHEMSRVLRRDGRLVIYDLVASDDPKKAERHNAIMKLRDPSHVGIQSAEKWHAFIRECGLHVAAKIVTMMKREFGDWMDMVGADPERRQRVLAAMLETVRDDTAGLGPRASGEKVTFSQTAAVWLVTK